MASREHDEFAAFCVAQHSRLVGTLTLHCGDRMVAEELAQEALARAWARWSEVGAMAAPGAWLHRVAINLSSSHYRRRKVEHAAAERSHGWRQSSDYREEHADVLAVRRELLGLPVRQRTALVLRYYSDLSVTDTAIAMRCRPGTVKSLTSQALKNLRARGLTDIEEQSHA